MKAIAVAGYVGAFATVLLGLLGACFPARAAKWVSIAPIGPTGISEIRATYGGLFLALGLACMLLRSPDSFGCAGLAWGGAAAGRLLSVVVDRNLEPRNIAGLLLEALLSALLIAPWGVGP